MEVPLPWERLLWSGRSWSIGGPRYALTDFRLVCIDGARSSELALYDVREVQSQRSLVDKALGTVTLVVHGRDPRRPSFIVHRIRAGVQLRGIIEILAGDAPPRIEATEVAAVLRWKPQFKPGHIRRRLVVVASVVAAVFGIVIGVQGKPAPVSYPPDDAIYPNGVKRDQRAIMRFMETSVMPWARTTLAPIVGGADRVSCQTCHGERPEDRGWAMPAVTALPKPDILTRGWELYSTSLDAQVRNAIYGYLAESDNQVYAAYMREHVMPGMARLLGRPAYDFTRAYEYNRTHFAFGCYHCHQVK
jgi:hypothetical protein